MSTRVAALPMIAGPIISRRPSARRYSTVEQLPIVSLINVPLRSWVPLAVHVAAFFAGRATRCCLPVGLAVGLAARCLAQKRYRLCAGMPSSAVRTRWDSRTELSIMMKFTQPRSTSLELA